MLFVKTLAQGSYFFLAPILKFWIRRLNHSSYLFRLAEVPTAPFVDLTVISGSSIGVNFTSPLSNGGSAINNYKVRFELLIASVLTGLCVSL